MNAFRIGNTVCHTTNGLKYYGTVRKIEITEEDTTYYVSFSPPNGRANDHWIAFNEDDLTKVDIAEIG